MSSSNAGVGTMSAADYQLVRERLWGAVIDRDEYAAAATVFATLDEGMSPEDVLLEVIAPVQQKVGLEWAANRITVAQEHAAILEARDVPAASLRPALDLLSEQLTDFPRSQRLLSAANAALVARPSTDPTSHA